LLVWGNAYRQKSAGGKPGTSVKKKGMAPAGVSGWRFQKRGALRGGKPVKGKGG